MNLEDYTPEQLAKKPSRFRNLYLAWTRATDERLRAHIAGMLAELEVSDEENDA